MGDEPVLNWDIAAKCDTKAYADYFNSSSVLSVWGITIFSYHVLNVTVQKP